MDFRWDVIQRYWPLLMSGLRLTIELTVIAVSIGTVIGLIASLFRLSKVKPVGWLAKGYVDRNPSTVGYSAYSPDDVRYYCLEFEQRSLHC